METSFVIIEGASHALALSSYLETKHDFKVVTYVPTVDTFVNLIDKLVFEAYAPRLCLCPGHLTAFAQGKISLGYFKEFESAVAIAGAKLILTTVAGGMVSGALVDAYARSWLEKRALDDGYQLVDILAWLGIRVEESRKNVG